MTALVVKGTIQSYTSWIIWLLLAAVVTLNRKNPKQEQTLYKLPYPNKLYIIYKIYIITMRNHVSGCWSLTKGVSIDNERFEIPNNIDILFMLVAAANSNRLKRDATWDSSHCLLRTKHSVTRAKEKSKPQGLPDRGRAGGRGRGRGLKGRNHRDLSIHIERPPPSQPSCACMR